MQFVTAYVRTTCPLCRSAAPTAYYSSGRWQCARCGGRWDARRLASVAAYDLFCEDRPSGQPVRPIHHTEAA
jgi:hypothetical protein